MQTPSKKLMGVDKPT